MRYSKGVQQLLIGLIAIVCLYLVALGMVRTVGMLALPYQAEYGEGPVLAWARQLYEGTLPYKTIDTSPYNFSVYTPLYLALSGAFIPLFPDNLYLGGRLLSLLSALALAGLLWRVAYRRGEGGAAKGAWLAAIPVLLWLVSPYVFRWSTFYRPDMLALFWSALGMVLIAHTPNSNEKKSTVVLAALSFVLAFFTKQSFFAAPLAALLWLLWEKRWRDAAWLVGAGAVLGAAVALGLYSVVGMALVDNLIAANANPFSWDLVGRFWYSFATIAPLLIVGAVVAMRHRENRLWAVYLALAGLVSISIGKAGAWENYFLEPLWGMCLLVGNEVRRLAPPRDATSAPTGQWLWVSLAVLAQLLLYTRGYERLSIPAEHAWLTTIRAEGASLREAVNAIPPDVPLYSEQMGVVAETGRPLLMHSFVYTQLARQGIWDESALLSMFSNGEGVVIQQRDAVSDPLRLDRWTEGMLNSIEQGYGLGTPVGEWLIRTATDDTRFYYPPTPQPLDNGFTLLNWEINSCTAEATCAAGTRPIRLTPNGTLTVESLWQSDEAVNVPLSLSVKLFAPDGGLVTQQDGAFRNGWMGRGWKSGAILRDAPRTLTLPPALPDGVYTVELTLYESESGSPLATSRLPYFGAQAELPPAVPVDSDDPRFGNRLTLVDMAEISTTAQGGEMAAFGLTWQADTWQPTPLTTFVHLLDASGNLVAQSDFTPPLPPSLWFTGESVRIPYTLTIPPDMPRGDYQLVVGWYESETLARLPLEDGQTTITVLRVTVE